MAQSVSLNVEGVVVVDTSLGELRRPDALADFILQVLFLLRQIQIVVTDGTVDFSRSVLQKRRFLHLGFDLLPCFQVVVRQV